MQRIGILGGTFDPPHIGHFILADYAIDRLNLSQLLFVPAADPPHKRNETRLPVEHRLGMLERAILHDSRFLLSLVDVNRPGPHYAVDTVHIIQKQYPGAELFFVMGSDSLRDLPRWYCPQELIEVCKLAVMPRPDVRAWPDMHESVLPGLKDRVVMIDAPLLGISSTEIVQRLRQGKSVRYLLPQPVLAYIMQHGIYQD